MTNNTKNKRKINLAEDHSFSKLLAMCSSPVINNYKPRGGILLGLAVGCSYCVSTISPFYNSPTLSYLYIVNIVYNYESVGLLFEVGIVDTQ
jgi:hypothetical protein